jgi:hypothetical protein
MKNSVFTSTKLTTFVLMFLGLFTSAQTPQQIQKITSLYDKTYLQELADQSLQKSEKEKKAALAYAQLRNIPVSYTTEDGTYVELQQILPDGTPIYYKTNNTDAAHSARTDHLNIGGSTGYDLDGQNMIAYVWDGGHPRITHQEYDGLGGADRVSIRDAVQEGGMLFRDHATHVTGTIAASGVVSSAKGMAPQSKVEAYVWNNDLGEATSAASNGMLLSNHSYSLDPATTPVQWFGAYKEDAYNWDNLMYHAPYYLMVKSAGNNGLDNSTNTYPLATGYDKLSGFGTSKNNLVVAAADDADVNADGSINSVIIYSRSSQGPTDDLRIKPDITGNGVGVYSAYAGSDTIYGKSSGTSMAAPNVTGSLLLLQQHHNNLNGYFMRAATLKGLALHTADDAGPVGPDAVWGWGLLNAKKAAETITQNGSESLIQELVISQGQTISLTVDSDGLNDLMASISWTDRPGAVNDELNSPTAALVNDLDIRIEKEVATYYPWRLTAPSANAKDGDNTKDPYERVDVENASGSYTITITHKGALLGGRQAFSLIITGIQPIVCTTASVPENVDVFDITGTSVLVSWDMLPGAFYDLRYRKSGATSWLEVADLGTNSYQMTGLDPTTEYELELRSKCSEGEPSGYSTIIEFSTLGIIYCDSHSPFANEDFYISNVKLNTINNTSTESNYSDFTDLSTELVAGQAYTISVTTTAIDDFRASYSVWIDYNGNGRLDDSGELVFTAISVANTETSGSFTVPMEISALPTRMRVSMINDEMPAGPCYTTSIKEGEVEDYSIYLSPAPNFIYENDEWTPEDPSGISGASDNIHIVNGTATLSADTEANNITVMSGAILKVENNLTIHGTLVFKSTSEGNGELAAVPESANITGNVTVERYMSNRRSYRMVSSAVTTSGSIQDNWQEGATSNTHNPAPSFGTHITGDKDGLNGFDATASGNSSMYYVRDGAQEFTAIENTNNKTLTAGDPYLLFVRGDRSIDLTANPTPLAKSTTLRATGSIVIGSQTQNFSTVDEDFVMFGNPYQSAVDMTSVVTNSNNVQSEFYYVYDPVQATFGSYVTVDLADGSNNYPGSFANQYLQPGQAGQVKVSGAASMIFNESDKAPGQHTATNRPMYGNDRLIVQLFSTEHFQNEGPAHDSFIMRFAEGNDNGITPKDAVKPMNFYENLGINHNGTYLSIERRAMPQDEEVYPLYSSGYQYSDYTLKLSIYGLDANSLYLEDYFKGTSTLLESGDTTYNFTVDKNDPLSIATGRFAIRTEARLDVDGHHMLAGIRLYPNPLDDNTFYINAPNLNGETVFISINDMLGREVFNTEQIFSGTILKVELSQGLSSGVYIVNLSSKGAERSLRIIKK